MNLFWSTRSLTASKEDHLTEFFAAAIESCAGFRTAYSNAILLDCVDIRRVQTQVRFPNTTCIPDMLLTLSDGRIIICEHKLDAIETDGSEKDDRSQLRRYLDLPVDGLIYVRSSWKPPIGSVLSHSKYLHPQDREHFLWRDFYPLLSSEDHVLLGWLRDGFERLGLTPPHPSVGEMNGADKAINRRNRTNFAKMWQSTKSVARSLGWKVTAGSISQLYLKGNPGSLAAWIFISPSKADRFLIRFTPSRGQQESVMRRLESVLHSLPQRIGIEGREVKRKIGAEKVIDVTTTLQEVLGENLLSADEIEAALHDFVTPFLKVVQA